MTDLEPIRRLAEQHVEFYSGRPSSPDGTRWVEQVWAPDIEIWVNVADQPTTRDQWIQSHSAGAGVDWNPVRLQVEHVHVAEQSFVLQVTLTGLGSTPIPICLVFAVQDGKVIRIHEYLDASKLAALTAPTAVATSS
jgi:hypothetical protein